MIGDLRLAILFGLVAFACKTPEPHADQQPAGVSPAVAATPPPVVSAVPPTPKLATVSFALFDGPTVLTCTEKTGPAEKIAEFKVPEKNTKLSQSCNSLGRVALTTCEMEHGTIKYYASKYSDDYMADCVKAGGKWTTNSSLEARAARADQNLAAVKAAAGIRD